MLFLKQHIRKLNGGVSKKPNSNVACSIIRKPGIMCLCGIILTILFYTETGLYETAYGNLNVGYLKGSGRLLLFDSVGNGNKIKEWRSQTMANCKEMMKNNEFQDNPKARQEKEDLERDSMGHFQFPTSVSSQVPLGHQAYQYCRHVFIDLGTNVGDSIGYFLDNALDICSPIWMELQPKTRLDAKFPRPHLDVTSLKIGHSGASNNPLYGMLQKQLSANVLPNEFCVYGMEGNPEFTDRLQKLENHIMQTEPRPVQHLHIHTESVVTAVDGPTKLYLDKTSVEQNFWGSSILSSQQDAVKSAKELGNGEVFSANVEGISLTTLVKNTLLAFKPDATPEDSTGGLLIIKMDVEGAEYQVLKEVAASNILCDYKAMGNRVVMIVEFHNMSITDPQERTRERAGYMEAKRKLDDCGVEFSQLQAFWH